MFHVSCFMFHVSCSMLVFVVPLCIPRTSHSDVLVTRGYILSFRRWAPLWTPQEKAMQWAEQAAIPATAVLPCRWGDWARGIVLACNAPGVRTTPKTWNTTSVWVDKSINCVRLFNLCTDTGAIHSCPHSCSGEFPIRVSLQHWTFFCFIF